EAHAPDHRERVGCRRRHPDRRMRLLVRARDDGQSVSREVLPGVREAFLGPGLQDEVERLLKSLAALVVAHAVARVGARKATAPDTEVETALADLIDGGGLFGGANGMAEGEHADAGADPHAARARGDRGAQHQRHRGDRRDARAHRIGRPPVHGEVPLGQPDAVEPLGLRDLGDVHRLRERFFLRPALTIVTFHHEADVHVALLRARSTFRSAARLYCALASRAGRRARPNFRTWRSALRACVGTAGSQGPSPPPAKTKRYARSSEIALNPVFFSKRLFRAWTA